jgi:murein DD-endopeptidase MepM/ murein hydrolase activator NlpD
MKAELIAWQERQKQLEQERKLEAEQQAKLAEQQKSDREAAAAQSSTPSTPSTSSTPSTQSSTPSTQPSRQSPDATPTVTQDGNFMRPATGTLTSPYGSRWGSTHHGIDIGKNGRSGDVPIVAAEAGTVITSTYSSSYGNMVMISHNVSGKVITTLYAHMENRLVTSGQRVSKGQKLGYMGNTGHSFGAHLHFEVHEGPWNGAKSNSVDPLRYIPRN